MATFNQPPNDIEIEAVLLGALLMYEKSHEQILGVLKPEMFYLEAHKTICAAIIRLVGKSGQVDAALLLGELRATNELEKAGGFQKLADITGRITGSQHIESYLNAVANMYTRRESIRIHTEHIAKLYDQTVDLIDTQTELEISLNALQNGVEDIESQTFEEVATQHINALQDIIAGKKPMGALIPYPTLSNYMGDRLRYGRLTVIGARPSVGKSAMALELFKHNGGLFVGYEMGNDEQFERWVVSETNINSYNFANPNKLRPDQWQQINSVVNQTLKQEKKYFFADLAGKTVEQLSVHIARHVRKEGIKFVVIDYLQLIKKTNIKGKNDAGLIGHITQTLKQLAKKLNIHIVLLSQINRDGANTIPTMDNLKASGDIEQDADNIWLLHEYSVDQWEDLMNRKGLISHSITEDEKLIYRRVGVHVAKQRGGRKGDRVPMYFYAPKYRFHEFNEFDSIYKPAGQIQPNRQHEDDTHLLNDDLSYENRPYFSNDPTPRHPLGF